jgi:hypothetical protein
MHKGDISALRKPAGMTNKMMGWVNLVDSAGRIRWQAHGPAKEQEIESLIKGVEAMKK